MKGNRPQQQPEPRFNLTDLSGQELDTIMGALLERPMKDVYALFGKLQNQIKTQMQQAPGDEEPDKPAPGAKESEKPTNSGNGKAATGKGK